VELNVLPNKNGYGFKKQLNSQTLKCHKKYMM